MSVPRPSLASRLHRLAATVLSALLVASWTAAAAAEPPAPPVMTPAPAAEPAAVPAAPVGPTPLLAGGHPVAWWFAYKFNSSAFPSHPDSAQACPFGGAAQTKAFSLHFTFASSEQPTLQPGGDFLGEASSDPLGATFGEVYGGSFHYVIWNDQFYGHPNMPTCGAKCDGSWGHSKGLLAWDDSGEGMIIQVTTPSWPASGSAASPRQGDGNTLGCITTPNNITNAQHFFALKLTHADVVAVLQALINASVVTDPANPQLAANGGPADIADLVPQMGRKSKSTEVIVTPLSSGVILISKPSALHVPPWQLVSSLLGSEPLRAATWWASPRIPSTRATPSPDCWRADLAPPGGVEIATKGQWAGRPISLVGGANHAKIGVSQGGPHPYVIFGDLNQQGALRGKCESSQNGRGGTFFVMENADLSASVTSLITGETAPFDGDPVH